MLLRVKYIIVLVYKIGLNIVNKDIAPQSMT